MSPRDRNLAVLLIAFILLGAGGAGGYLFVYSPIRDRQAAAAKLEEEVAGLDAKLAQARKDAPRLAAARRRSLPADPTLAQREYGEMLNRLLLGANAPLGFRVTPRSTDAAGVPLLAPKKPAYSRVAFDVAFDKADMWVVHDFLAAYYRLNLLHQITAIEIKTDVGQPGSGGGRGRSATADRKDLSVKLTTEAIVLDGAEPRRTLLPVSTAFAAAGGLAGYNAIALVPEAGRALTPLQLAPVLAGGRRDYSLIVQNDLFHGPIPAAPPPPVREEPPLPDSSDAIRLVMATTRSDGSALAVVRDNFNPFNYEIEADAKGVRVTKYVFFGAAKRKDRFYGPPDQLMISDEEVTKTNRQFKVVSIAEDGLVLIDLKPSAAPGSSKPGTPPGGAPGRRGPRAGQDPVGALALVGTAAAEAPSPADQPTLYRWAVGKSLKGLTEVPRDEARKILQRAAETGPVGATAVATGQ